MTEEELREYLRELAKDQTETLRQQAILELSAFDLGLSDIFNFDYERSETIEDFINSIEVDIFEDLLRKCLDQSFDTDSKLFKFYKNQEISKLKNELTEELSGFSYDFLIDSNFNFEEISLDTKRFRAFMSEDPEELDKLSTHPHEFVREFVIQNKKTSKDTLIKMEKVEEDEELLIMLSRLCGDLEDCARLYDMYIDQLNLIIKTFQISLGLSEEDLKLMVEYVNEEFDLKTLENNPEEIDYEDFEAFVIDYVESLKESYENSDLMFSLRNPVKIVRTPRPKK